MCPERYCLPTSFPIKAHLEINTASSQADSKLVPAEDNETNLTSSHSATEESQEFDFEGAPNQTCLCPTICN